MVIYQIDKYILSFPDNKFTESTLQGYLNRVAEKIISDNIPAFSTIHQAIIFAMAGNRNKMMEYLEKANKRIMSEVHVWIPAPIFDRYHSDPEFVDFFKKLNLDRYHMLN